MSYRSFHWVLLAIRSLLPSGHLTLHTHVQTSIRGVIRQRAFGIYKAGSILLSIIVKNSRSYGTVPSTDELTGGPILRLTCETFAMNLRLLINHEILFYKQVLRLLSNHILREMFLYRNVFQEVIQGNHDHTFIQSKVRICRFRCTHVHRIIVAKVPFEYGTCWNLVLSGLVRRKCANISYHRVSGTWPCPMAM